MSVITYTVKNGKVVRVKGKPKNDRMVQAGDRLVSGYPSVEYDKNWTRVFGKKRK